MSIRFPWAAVVAALLLGALAAAPASAAEFSYTVVSIRTRYIWTEHDKGYPKRCESWTKGGGVVEQNAAEFSGVIDLDRLSGALLGADTRRTRGTVTRTIDYTGHTSPEAQPCVPCDRGEYGPCREAKPDTTVRQTCGPKQTTVDASLSAYGQGLTLTAPFGADALLAGCPEPDDPDEIADLSPSNKDYGKLTLRNGARRLFALAVKDRLTLEFTGKKGRCAQVGRRGDHRCVTTAAKVVFRRTG
ncbi:hypothetical protein VSS74_21400 [Conexibacter stalactiti]|uniref:Uncharacterized protein n=1 Tax=Conexibacter stalactiti TaxID=1940611 RepID=A0ABU4HUE8_9ACTN|nr:hypothetical protein [Conexibacter stalactiti]MDW5596918.1 hypothetical protein [Conexibacter stalactiti]MEC5037560.1 hypothetical protein [Conexibacter stalactiti]